MIVLRTDWKLGVSEIVVGRTCSMNLDFEHQPEVEQARGLLAMFDQPTRRSSGEADTFVLREWLLNKTKANQVWHRNVEERLKSRLIDSGCSVQVMHGSQ